MKRKDKRFIVVTILLAVLYYVSMQVENPFKATASNGRNKNLQETSRKSEIPTDVEVFTQELPGK